MQNARLVFSYPNETLATAIAHALTPETESGVPKTTSRVRREGHEIHITIDADDLASLRAALNSYVRWAEAAERAARAGTTGA